MRQFWRPATLIKIFVFLSITFICIAFFFLRSGTFLDWVEGRLERELRKQITDNYTVDVGEIKGNIFGSVTLSRLSISRKDEPTQPVISTGKVVLKYNLLGLLTRRFEVKTLEVSEPQIYVVRDSDDSLNLTRILKKPQTTQETRPFDFTAESVRCHRGRITYLDTQQDLHITVNDISLQVNGTLNTWNRTNSGMRVWHSVEGRLRIGKGHFTFNGAETAINNVDADFVLSETDGSHLKDFHFRFGDSDLRVNGGFRHTENGTPAWDAGLALELDVSDVQQFFGEAIELEGLLNVQLEAEGTDSAVDVKTFSVNMPTFHITPAEKGQKIEVAALEAEGHLKHLPAPTLTLTTLRAHIADGSFSGEGTLALETGPEGTFLTYLQHLTTTPFNYTGKGRVKDIEIIPFLSMFVQLPEYLSDSSGHLSGTATFSGTQDLSHLNLDSEITLAQTTLNGVVLEDSKLNCTIEAGTLEANGNFDTTAIEMTAPFPLGQQDALKIQARGIPFYKLTKIANTAPFGGIGTSSATLSAAGTLKGVLKVPDATFNDIPLGVLTGTYRYQDGRVFIEEGLLTKRTRDPIHPEGFPSESRAMLSGTVDIQGEFPTAFRIVADPVYVQHYPKLLLGAEYPVAGELSGELTLGGTLVHLDGSADFTVTDGVAWGVHLDPLRLPLRIEDYNISIPDFKITTRGQQLTLNVDVAATGDLDLHLKSDAPVRFEEIAKAAGIADFPFEGEFNVQFVGRLRESEAPDFRVELDCSDITYLQNPRGTHYPLGDVYLFGKLVEGKESDIYDFQGHGFDSTSRIRGTVSMTEDTPYDFIIEGNGMEVSPFLRPLHPTLEVVTGTATGRVSIRGTIADLAPTPTADPGGERSHASGNTTDVEAKTPHVYPYTVDIHIVSSHLQYAASEIGQALRFTNAEPIRLHLKEDIWTIETLALRTLGESDPFIQLTGTFDARKEAIDFLGHADGFALAPFLPAFGLLDHGRQTDTGGYRVDITGTPTNPVLALDWAFSTLTFTTEGGDVVISDAGGHVQYQDEVLRLEDCAFKFLGNAVNVEGTVDIHPEAIDNSELHLRVDSLAVDLATLPIGMTANTQITGMLEASLEIGGTLLKPHLLLYAETAAQRPIYFSAYLPALTLERLRVDIDVGSESIRIDRVEANGQMGVGTYRVKGEAVFSRRDTDAMGFALDVTASQLPILVPWADYGIASGHVRLSGTGLTLEEITLVGEINELLLDTHDFHLVNRAPLQFRSDPTHRRNTEPTAECAYGIPNQQRNARGAFQTNSGMRVNQRYECRVAFPGHSVGVSDTLAVEIPLHLTSPTLRASIHIRIGGTLDAPTIAGVWQGTLNGKAWTGNLQYTHKQITVVDMSLKDDTRTLTLRGDIPFDLAFVSRALSERHLEAPMALRLKGSELPLDFFPGLDTLFSQTEGTVDIDLTLQGTTHAPYLLGNVSLEALQLVLKDFHEPIRNLKVHLTAQENRVDVRNFAFKMGSGACRLQGGSLDLEGCVPKGLRLVEMRLEHFPLGSTVREAVPLDQIEDIEGHLTVSLKELSVPLDRFFRTGERLPLPRIREMPSLVDLVAVSNATFSIDSVRLAFTTLNRQYDFQDPHPVSIGIRDGAVTLTEPFRLENHETFSIKQTFSDEDTKPEDLLVDERTISGKTTLRIDAGDIYRTNGHFDIALRVANVDVSPLTEALPPPYRVTGAVSGSFQVTGTSENPKITLRRHTRDPAELYLHDVPIDLRWRLRYQNGTWEISKKRYVEVTYGENLLTFSWTMPYPLQLLPFLRKVQQAPEVVWRKFQQTPMEGTLDVKITDLDMLPFGVPGLDDATGTGNIHVKLTGTLQAPQATGSVFFEDVGLEFPETAIEVKQTVGEIRLSEKGASIKRFEGSLNDGNFSIRGSITAPPVCLSGGQIWQTPPVLDVFATLTDVVFEQPETYRADLHSAEFHLHGDLLKPALTGNLNIDGGYYQQNWESVRDWLTGVSIKEADVALDYPLLRDLHLNLDIDIPADFRVLSSITGPTDFEIACSGKLSGPIKQPVFTGDMSVHDGKIGLILQSFEFIEGSISNRDSFNFNPNLNILLRTPNRIRGVLPRDESIVDIQVHATLTGTLNNPHFILSAPTATTPEVLTHEDIMAFLLRNTAFARTYGGFTFSVQRPFEEDARYQAEYPLSENMSIKIETNDQGEHGVDIEFKGRF